MPTPILATKLYIPPTRPQLVPRPRLIEQMNERLRHTPSITLISAPAGFGKTTLVSEWVSKIEHPSAWLSLDGGDSDPSRFLIYLISALQTVERTLGGRLLGILEAPQPPPLESILNRMCGSLCDAVLSAPPGSGQETLEYLERANLFIVPLDNERRWYRYHHLFAELLRQRLQQNIASPFRTGNAETNVNELHFRASKWFEEHGLQMEAFQHAAAAHDIERAEGLIDAKGIPLHFSGGVTPILNWLESLPADVMNARPSLWWRYAAMLLMFYWLVRVLFMQWRPSYER